MKGKQQKRTLKIKKNDYSSRERLEKLGLSTLGISVNLIEMFKAINEISNNDRNFFQYFFLKWKFTVKEDFKNYVN